MSNKHDKLCFHNTEEVLEAEALAFGEIHGSLEDEEIFEQWKSKVNEWITKEKEILDENVKKDPENVYNDRMNITVEDEQGNIYICMKMFCINRLWKIAGTEP